MKIAIVEDDISMRKSLELFFKDYKDLEIVAFKNPKDALKALDESFELVITDINMPHMDGLEFLTQLNGRYEAIVITGNATLNKAIESIRLGVKDFFQKPFEPQDLLNAIYRSKKILQFNKEHTSGAKNSGSVANAKKNKKLFKSTSSRLEEAKSLALKVAPTDASVLLLGASGVGKEVFAKFIHENSKRAAAPFLALNMAAIPEHLLESELFGYEKGAFTDATAPKPGLLESAQGGTVFLDEIGEMPLGLQAKLLRALQEKEIIRLGSSKTIKIDVRFISATNANIQEKIANNEFREDLFFRLQTVPIKIPPLRERSEEILPLAQIHLQEVCEAYGFSQKCFDDSAKERLLAYSWPGNIRELLSVVERACILSEGNTITAKDLYLDEREKGLVG
ncbi:response regulator [Helicobacter saguini]|uniref:Response regulator n=1 Tax=Helicobacter saguini TaxID=1548018 RepID=A0A347VN14_9HELI|nr:sigma-54 dependent transcriptional regulator [Helicobacter saguini]MWV67384.1 response regulator [Helicobacter saguini]MWV69737.1 response regulator [Helicobacter saguini]MWV73046.1 response regulator [Helicobacter saguini]TLD95578.1 sigma-54-dependent Fis family transcriptional regulator [Helicobacter saguini]